MIFQEPMSALNPSMKCGIQVSEVLLQHETITEAEANTEVLRLFERVKIPNSQTKPLTNTLTNFQEASNNAL